MGYSNNKWRNILTILMIINLCFILFAKFSTVFGSFSVDIPDTSNTLNLPDFFKDYNFLVLLRWNSGYNKYTLKIALISTNNKYYSNTNTASIHIEKQENIKYLAVFAGNNSGFPDLNSLQIYLDGLSLNLFNDVSVNAQGTTNIEYNPALIENGTFKYITNTNIFNGYSGIQNNDISFEQNATVISYPFFDNVTEIENGNPDGVLITPGDYSKDDNLYFHLLQINTGLSNADNSIYYYSDKIFILNKDCDYYTTWYEPSIEGFYYYIPRYKLGLSQNTSYLYVLNNSKNQIQNSSGLYEIDKSNGIYDVVQSDTAGVITATEEETDRMRNIEATITQNQEITNNINDSLTNTTVSEETETDIESSLNFSNDNSTISNLRNGFFTRLSSMLANLTNYNLREDTSVSVPLPHSNKNLTFHSIDIYNNVPEPLKTIINLFWVFVFNFYLFKFVNHLYISITTGKILKDFNAKNEVITDHML